MRVDRRLAQRLVVNADPSLRVDDVRLVKGGEISAVYEVACVGGRRVIVKVYPDRFHWKMQKEVYVYDLVRQRVDVPMPVVLHADDSKELLPRSYVVMTKVDGQPVAAVESADVSAGELASIYREMGTHLRRLHGITFGEFGYIFTGIPEPHSDNRSYMRFQFEKKLREFAGLGGDEELGQSVASYVTWRGGLFARCETAVLCHNDYHAHNVLVARRDGGWRVTGIVDVENALAGDPLLDIAKTYYYGEHYGGSLHPVKLDAFLEGYGPLPDDSAETLRLYKLYHALELWDWYSAAGNDEPLAALARHMRALAGP